MSFYRRSRSLPKRFRLILASFLQRPGLPFADALPEDAIQKAFDDEEAGFADDQEAYPQAHTQREGLGFPVAGVVVLLSLATGTLTDMAMGPYTGKETGETALLRQLLERLRPGDILLGDRCFCSYFMIALLMELGVDFVTRVHQRRPVEFRRGRRLGRDVLRCKTPEMVRKEMWTCLLAYNLIRQTMLQSAQEADVSPRGLSFTAAMQSIAASWLVIASSDDTLATLLIDAASVAGRLAVLSRTPSTSLKPPEVAG